MHADGRRRRCRLPKNSTDRRRPSSGPLFSTPNTESQIWNKEREGDQFSTVEFLRGFILRYCCNCLRYSRFACQRMSARLAAWFSGRGVSSFLRGRLPAAREDWCRRLNLRAPRRVQYVAANLPPRTALDGTRYRPPTPVDLHFLVTAWEGLQEQFSMLGWIIRTLEDTPVLPAGLLNRFGGNRGEVFTATKR